MEKQNFSESEHLNEVMDYTNKPEPENTFNPDFWDNLNEDEKWDGDPECENCTEQHIGCMFNCSKIKQN